MVCFPSAKNLFFLIFPSINTNTALMFVDKQICCQESLIEWLGNGGPKGDLTLFLMTWKLLNVNEMQWLLICLVRTEGLTFLHHVRRMKAFFSEADPIVCLSSSTGTAKELRTPPSLGLSSCQGKRPRRKRNCQASIFFPFTSASKIRWLKKKKKEAVNLISDWSEITRLRQTAAPLVWRKRRDDSSLLIKKKRIPEWKCLADVRW